MLHETTPSPVDPFMTDTSGLEALRGLHQDLLALTADQLQNIDRLWSELDARVDEFKRLLDKPPKNEASRKLVQSGMLPFVSRACFDREWYCSSDQCRDSRYH